MVISIINFSYVILSIPIQFDIVVHGLRIDPTGNLAFSEIIEVEPTQQTGDNIVQTTIEVYCCFLFIFLKVSPSYTIFELLIVAEPGVSYSIWPNKMIPQDPLLMILSVQESQILITSLGRSTLDDILWLKRILYHANLQFVADIETMVHSAVVGQLKNLRSDISENLLEFCRNCQHPGIFRTFFERYRLLDFNNPEYQYDIRFEIQLYRDNLHDFLSLFGLPIIPRRVGRSRGIYFCFESWEVKLAVFLSVFTIILLCFLSVRIRKTFDSLAPSPNSN